ncbi:MULTISPECIES: hypothetical protein [Lactobacillus]|uniref:hypothetical protein n=1 Tax=Lactobacillus TaxID=1578 RepID=UPI0018A6D150|nr:hypothetical protein [Lactobacillus porci]MDD6416828.1 hypothetical protein [Lactobacillus porci]
MAEKDVEASKIKELTDKLEEEISLSYYLKPGTITVSRDLIKALQDLLENPENWEEN